LGQASEGEIMDVVFCICGRIAKENGFCSEKCRTKKPKPPRKGHWSGASKYRKETGEWEIHKE